MLYSRRIMPSFPRHPSHALQRVGYRLRPRLWPIVQTALAAVAAWTLADLLVPSDEQPVFAAIATVISLGASFGQRGRRAVELVVGVVLGLTIAGLILSTIGTGPLQIGVMIVLCMSAAVILRGGELLINEAAISAMLLVSLASVGGEGLTLQRSLEALIGGGVALVVNSLLFPPHPARLVSRAAHEVFGRLGRTLEEIGDALRAGDPERAESALAQARGLDGLIAELEGQLLTAKETARFSPPRRAARVQLDRFSRTLPQVDFATRNTRVLARHALRYTRSRLVAPDELTRAVEELAQGVWALAAQYDEPEHADAVRGLAIGAAGRATTVFEQEPDLALTEIVAQVRSTAVDLLRASEQAGDAESELLGERPTEELLAAAPA